MLLVVTAEMLQKSGAGATPASNSLTDIFMPSSLFLTVAMLTQANSCMMPAPAIPSLFEMYVRWVALRIYVDVPVLCTDALIVVRRVILLP